MVHKSKIRKDTMVILKQVIDLTTALNSMKELVNHDYSKGKNDELSKVYELFDTRRKAFTKQMNKMKRELTNKQFVDVQLLIEGDYEKVEDKDLILNRASSYVSDSVTMGWDNINKDDLITVIRDDYKLKKIGGPKFVKNDKHIQALKERLENPVIRKGVEFVVDSEQSEDESKSRSANVEFDVKKPRGGKTNTRGGASKYFYDGSQTQDEINALTNEQKFLINELRTAYQNQENPDTIFSEEYSKIRTDARYVGINVEQVEIDVFLPEYYQSKVDVTVEDVENPDIEKDPDAQYLSKGTGDVDEKSTTTQKTKVTISTSNTKHQDGANSEFTLGDNTAQTTEVGGATPDVSVSDPYTKPVDVDTLDINELRDRLRSQTQTETNAEQEQEVKKTVKTGVFQGFGTVPEVIVEEVSRTTGEVPTNPQQAVNMASGNEVEEEKARNKKDIERLKFEIKGLHITFDVLIPALREKNHQLRFKLAMDSKDKKVVMKHHAEMMERVRIYFSGGMGNNLKVGVVVPLDAYMSSFFSGVNSGEGNIDNITNQTQPKGEHHKRGSGSKIVAKSIYYQRGGMSAVKGQGVSGHQVPSTLIKIKRGKIVDPLQLVDAPYEHVLNRKANGGGSFGLKIKSKK